METDGRKPPIESHMRTGLETQSLANQFVWSAEDQAGDRLGQNVWITCGHSQDDIEAIQMSALVNGPWIRQTSHLTCQI